MRPRTENLLQWSPEWERDREFYISNPGNETGTGVPQNPAVHVYALLFTALRWFPLLLFNFNSFIAKLVPGSCPVQCKQLYIRHCSLCLHMLVTVICRFIVWKFPGHVSATLNFTRHWRHNSGIEQTRLLRIFVAWSNSSVLGDWCWGFHFYPHDFAV